MGYRICAVRSSNTFLILLRFKRKQIVPLLMSFPFPNNRMQRVVHDDPSLFHLWRPCMGNETQNMCCQTVKHVFDIAYIQRERECSPFNELPCPKRPYATCYSCRPKSIPPMETLFYFSSLFFSLIIVTFVFYSFVILLVIPLGVVASHLVTFLSAEHIRKWAISCLVLLVPSSFLMPANAIKSVFD